MQAVGVTRSRIGLLTGISLLAAVFTVALTFATLELPRTLGNWLYNYFPDIHHYTSWACYGPVLVGREHYHHMSCICSGL